MCASPTSYIRTSPEVLCNAIRLIAMQLHAHGLLSHHIVTTVFCVCLPYSHIYSLLHLHITTLILGGGGLIWYLAALSRHRKNAIIHS